MAEIIVRGHAEAQLPPTEAGVSVIVHARAPKQSDAVRRCAEQSDVVDRIVADEREEVVRQAVTTSLRTTAEYEFPRSGGRRLVGYSATRQTTLACAPEADGLTRLFSALAGLDDVRVSGPDWRIQPDAPGWDDVRAAAAADCRRRAAAYAAGLGVEVGRVVWIAEPGLRLAEGPERAPEAFMSASRAGTVSGGEEEPPTAIRITPEPITISVTVEAQFDLA
ncbi:SIMPL domain-containing protein [Euzebya tangerina]|uniref:SIMPL domain-containing protein n=1 Tax=Euzebya tangerina TaxID=591198 RepID=UPI000E30DF1F|nr:SIMPL domain-containing protein [Euzebya tangerina]